MENMFHMPGMLFSMKMRLKYRFIDETIHCITYYWFVVGALIMHIHRTVHPTYKALVNIAIISLTDITPVESMNVPYIRTRNT
jgi:hypothetical protein